MHVDDLLAPWQAALTAGLPGLRIRDVHTHIGSNDPDGFRSEPAELVAALGRADARGVVFPMHEPSGYPAANDRVLAVAAESDGRLAAFCRVSPHERPAAEAERALDAGARGIKLHPRAEGFALSHPGVAEVCTVAAERRVPVLTHAGRGIPALGRDALALSERHPGLSIVLAHAGVSDLSWIWREASAHPNVLFDTAWWSVSDLLALFALVPPGQIVFGSDAPYGTPVAATILALRCAIQAGLSEEQIRSVMGEQAERLLAGEPPRDVGEAPGEARLSHDVLLGRVHTVLAVAARQHLHGEEADQEIALARLACDIGRDTPQAATCAQVLALLDLAQEAPPERPGSAFQHRATHLIVTASAVARTPDAAMPLLASRA